MSITRYFAAQRSSEPRARDKTLFQLVMLALVASIHVLNTARDLRREDVDGQDKPDHDEVIAYGRGRAPESRSAQGRAIFRERVPPGSETAEKGGRFTCAVETASR